jgi:hypothetical protein
LEEFGQENVGREIRCFATKQLQVENIMDERHGLHNELW